VATAGGFGLTLHRVLEELFHLGAVWIVALGVGARRSVDEQRHSSFDLLLSGLALGVGHLLLFASASALALQRVLVTDADAALLANVKVSALCASVTGTGFEFASADVTGSHECWFGRVVQVVQHHHRRVLCATQRIKLEVISLTQRKKRLPRIEKLGLHGFVLLFFDFLIFHARQRRALLAHQLASV
jgi:hypothetical protein